MKQPSNLSRRGGFSLVEVMVAAVIFTMLAVSATSVFLQNNRMMATLRYRTHVTNTALSIVEQLRLNEFATIKGFHDAATPTVLINLPDPTYVAAAPDISGYRPTSLNINVLDGVQKNTNWTYTDLFVESSTTAPKAKARFWTAINANISAASPVVEIYEVAIMYQWKNPAAKATDPWQSNTIRLTVPNPNPKT